MQISFTDAEDQLTDLVRRVEAGDEVILTRYGHAAVRLVPINTKPDWTKRKALLDRIRTNAAGGTCPGPDAARSQDFLYDEDGLPG
ncbi:prevent-host-death family protein [Ameyamaea chiangmaiensis NBRC 103196]|uniref:Antitoxin n=1 Tax=Ameyamaea chiangmaiensis TaxID=442969 RepID=A0A850P5B9_9PROT|nr:type II toxin-antitoxin system prevent-host-death family antitoxin [Ameyamaea chiangmaiensis]MBS4076052.1 type II toxin-antitoxin system prevent-host-death family antitoxin [Ameyamaea chiangmaiensis]NVN39827.1 type II toxin-antitoxin system prevent-host-death family antitoxin [Ameyamaea chiangmaiensis]GBQ66842.1 prevent-host-death family protein [Ameyamaea chiangmaiensis NBRC 103196]